ncbi:endothelin-converting enzyme 2 [Dermacentor silvarum]|uniref:endothelin-converting enzyme 2 n=1 Tax=Dermacentor silvarum TaxID=543639 RepID=UPI001896D66A|nr:endothelin-converting enzyme 2 [Dermacentor silvarum]
MHGRHARKKMEREQKKLQAAMSAAPSARSHLGGGSHITPGSPTDERSPTSPKLPKSPVSSASRGIKAGAKPGKSRKSQTLGSAAKGSHQSLKSRDPEVPPANIHLSLPSHLETAKSPPPSSRKKAAICAGCSVALVVVAAVAVSSAWFGKKAWIGRAHCHTKECARVNAMLMEARNASVAPCDNFYQHVCGRWSLNHSGYSVYDRHANEFLNKLADTLIKTVVGTQESPTTKVARFYQTCLMVVVEGRDQTAEYHKAFEMAGVLWPRMGTDGDAYMVEAKLQAYFHASSMLEIRRVKDYGGEVYLRISPANAQAVWRRNLPLLFPRSSGDTSTYRDYYDSACQAYAAGMAGVVGFDTFFDIEKKVYDKTHFDQSEDRKNLTSLTSLAELSDVMRNESAQQLTKFVMATYDLPVATSVTVKGPEYLKRFGELVSELGDDKVIFYLGWLLLQVVWRALDRHTNTLWHKHFRLRVSSHILRQQEVDCLEFTEQLLGWALFYRFTYENSGENSTEMVEQMAENIGRAFKQQLSFNQIFTEVYLTKENFTELLFYRKRFTEANLRQRLDKMGHMTDSAVENWETVAKTRLMMSEEDWSDMATHYVWWLRTKHTYTLYNSIRKNLRGPPLYGELPLFGEQSTEAANYGALGTAIGEAAVRMIERKFVDANKTDLTGRMDCVYAANPEIPRSVKQPVYRSSAVDIVYDAFTEAASKRTHQSLKNFGRDKTFFQMMCYLMCEGSLKDAKISELSCNQAVKDSQNFGKVFGCPIGSPMNPASKCRLFY